MELQVLALLPPVAAKRSGNEKTRIDEDFYSEVQILLFLPPHPHLIAVYGACNGPLQLIMEYCSGGRTWSLLTTGSLHDYLSENELKPDQLKIILRGVASALRHIHSYSVIHR